MVRAWHPDPAPSWVTGVPSSRGLVRDLAGRVADRLDLPYLEAIHRTQQRPPQKTQQNSCRQARNVLGAFAIDRVKPDPVLLIDDTVDSRWTLTVLGSLLRSAGSGPVYPVVARRHLGKRRVTPSADAKAVIALTTRLGNSRRPSLSPTRWHRLASVLADNGLTPGDVFDPALEIEAIPGMSFETATSIRELLTDASVATVAADELGRMGIWTLTVVDDDYPRALTDRLFHNAPPVIFGVGDPSLLTGEGIGIVGSRNVTAEGTEVAQRIATAAVQLSRPVVSGGARGVDQVAMNCAYQSGGSVVGVLADSLQSRVRNPDILRALDAGSTCLITQQAPSAGFTPAAAMGRNKLIYALSEVTVVVACEEATGGTWPERPKPSGARTASWPSGGATAKARATRRSSIRERSRSGPQRSCAISWVSTARTKPEQLGLLDSA